MYRFRDIATYLLKVADFDAPHLHLAPPQGVIVDEFRGDLWHQKARVPVLSCGVLYVILCLAVLVELVLATDRQTQSQTESTEVGVSPTSVRGGACARRQHPLSSFLHRGCPLSATVRFPWLRRECGTVCRISSRRQRRCPCSSDT